MDFRTKANITKAPFSFNHSNDILLVGSCFSNNIGEKLKHYHFNCSLNPFGILFNPISILNSLQRIESRSFYDKDELLEYSGKWLSLDHHTSFSNSNQEDCLNDINVSLIENHKYISEESVLLITFGTAWVYEWKENGIIVGNCHKIPQSQFNKRLLTVEEIVNSYKPFLKDLYQKHKGIKVVFTVSPVRHLKDGMRENQISKSVLHLSVQKLIEELNDVYYFPSYEILMDDLRDYRFYKSDMLHPNEIAVDYVWNFFANTFFTENTRKTLKEIHKINQAIEHKPFNPDSPEHKIFLKNLKNKIQDFQKRNPQIKLPIHKS